MLNREIHRHTRVVGSFPNGNSALMLICARLCHVAGAQWGNKKYINMKHLETAVVDVCTAGWLHLIRSLQGKVLKIRDTTDENSSIPILAIKNAECPFVRILRSYNDTPRGTGSGTRTHKPCGTGT